MRRIFMKILFNTLTLEKVKREYDYIDREISRLEDGDNEIILDFSTSTWIEPAGMLFFGSKIRKLREEHPELNFQISDERSSSSSYYEWMGMFNYFLPDSDIGQVVNHNSGNDRYIPISHMNIIEQFRESFHNDEYGDKGSFIAGRSGQLASIITRDQELFEILKYVIREIIRNVPEHSGTDDLWLCAQAWTGHHNRAQIVIMDEGMGIYKSLLSNDFHKQEILDNEAALIASINPGISKAFMKGGGNHDDDIWSNSGFGLFVVSEICKRLGGKFMLVSGDNYIYKSSSTVNVESGINDFNGTMIIIELPLNIGDIDSKELISTIVDEGEQITLKYSNTITKASVPSRTINF